MTPLDKLSIPQGYVEYPRNSKFRTLDKIGRLELLVRGVLAIRFCVLVLATIIDLWILFKSDGFGWQWLVCAALCGWLTIGLRAGLTCVMKAKGLEPGWATVLAVAFGGLGLILSCGYMPAAWSTAVFAVAVIVSYSLLRVDVRSELQRFQIEQPRRISSRWLGDVVQELRRAELGVEERAVQLVQPPLDLEDQGQDPISKLEWMTKGSYAMKWPAISAILLDFVWRTPWNSTGPIWLVLECLLVLFLSITLRTALSRFFKGNGLSETLAVLIALAFSVLGLVISLGYISFLLSAALFFIPLLGILIWVRGTTSKEFIKLGRTMPLNMDYYELARYFYELRQSVK